jgi:NADH:ubiquinone oxidoreductase subunit F (NADH-binding)
MTGPVESAIAPVAYLGSPSARLLGGKRGSEKLHEHFDRLGSLPPWRSRGDALAVIEKSGLAGRGGGYFPLATKIAVARAVGERPVVVINATESEPASSKDRLLMTCRPHLVLDGGQTLAEALGADRVIVAAHAGAPGLQPLMDALGELRCDAVPVSVVTVPGGYVTGESSALVSWINGGPAVPSGRARPTAVSGVDGRPTIVSNVETVAHLGLICRFGADWFRSAGSRESPGSVLLTVTGDVRFPATVIEVVGPATIGDALAAAGGTSGVPSAVLLGGYGGTWRRASEALAFPVDASRLRRLGAPLGCGLVSALDSTRCGLAEAARLLRWLSGERAAQCGACAFGLPQLAERMEAVATGVRRSRREVRRIVALGEAVSGRGLCHLPDGAVAMAESALVAFGEELRLHRRGRCSAHAGPVLPLPGQQHEGERVPAEAVVW